MTKLNKMWNSNIRDARNEAHPLVLTMLSDLKAGSVTPALSIAEAEARYGRCRLKGDDPHASFGQALQSLAAKTGSVLVITDKDSSAVYGQVADPGYEIEHLEMGRAFSSLVFQLSHSGAVETCLARTSSVPAKGIEFPIFSMPKHQYQTTDGEAVGLYGRYVASYSARPNL
jgi:hypothetical protein